MDRVAATWLLALGFALLAARAGAADQLVTDASLVTGLDISDSITADDRKLQLVGMARAIRAPDVLHAIQTGPHGCIGFAMFAWSYGHFPTVVSWTPICSPVDAEAVSERIMARLAVDVEAEARSAARYYPGRPTDLSEALRHAQALLQAAPFATDRPVINIIGNGDDNVGEGPAEARDRIVQTGSTINGVVLGNDKETLDYYRREVVGGPSAFVLSIDTPANLVSVLTRKLLGDVVAGVSSAPITIGIIQRWRARA